MQKGSGFDYFVYSHSIVCSCCCNLVGEKYKSSDTFLSQWIGTCTFSLVYKFFRFVQLVIFYDSIFFSSKRVQVSFEIIAWVHARVLKEIYFHVIKMENDKINNWFGHTHVSIVWVYR